MNGGTGSDTYFVDNGGDTTVETVGGAASSIDLANASVNRSLGVDNQVLFGVATTGTGNNLANSITGNAIGNTLSGLGGNDILIGGAGPDILIGGLNNDTFVYNALANSPFGAADRIREGGGAIAFQGVGGAAGDRIDLTLIELEHQRGRQPGLRPRRQPSPVERRQQHGVPGQRSTGSPASSSSWWSRTAPTVVAANYSIADFFGVV